MTEESAVKVCVRVRPLIAREESAASENAEPPQLFWKSDKKSIHQIDDGNSTKSFSFDRVFIAEETTNQLYQDIAKPLVVSTVEGYNGTIFAYGQTSSGKTFTMMGSDQTPGVIPLAVEDVFQTIKNFPKKEFLLRVSYMEIYNETVTDLLVDSWKRRPLEVRETINKNIYVADLTEEMVVSSAQALAWIRKGEKNRHYGKTKMNQRSSRSHTIFRMILESRERSDPASGENVDGAILVSHLNLVDLAGSERASQTGAEGARLKEGCNINRSLFTLGQVIKKVTDESQKGFTNYRDSKLTRILQNSLGGNAKTVIICTITPVALDETLSTLQFASTAKKMKNDPHVTEVSDDGALLKRYRNEIVDLKRRLQEVSSITQTTATEKEVLSQLLQEREQLQREQQDRIRNLTKLIVTSSNLVPVKKMPKRRVTWGGKMLRLSNLPDSDGGPSDLSFAGSFAQKRKADHSCLTELAEDEEIFYSHWEIPDESDDMEMSRSSVTTQSFGDSPKVCACPDQMRELSEKVSVLELKLEAEAQQKMEAVERAEMFQLRTADLERQLEDQSHAQTESEQIKREFAETIQLCETLASEKDAVIAERDYMKQELGMFIEQTEILETEKAALSQELEEKGKLDEFQSLEEECRVELEDEFRNEISILKKTNESFELQCQKLQNKIETLSEELKRKTEFAEELQNLDNKDLVQEVAKLRRSLDDAEGVSRDTKKDWAVLRSQNIALEEMNVNLTANHNKMEAEVNSLRFQLETEKSHYKKMQSDLQKELNVAFDENTKLNALLDGKVPKSLIDNVELERTVGNLNKELAASRETEAAHRAKLEELASLQTLPNKVCELTEELCTVKTERDSLLSAHSHCQEEAQQLRGSLQTSQDEIQKMEADRRAAAQRETELSHQCADVTQQLDSLQSDLQRLDSEKSQLMAVNEERALKLSQLGEELEALQAERDAVLSGAQSSAEETEKLLSTVTLVTAERDQLRLDLQQNQEMVEQLQASLQVVSEQKSQLESDLQQNKEMATALQEQNQRNLDLERQSQESQARLEQESAETQCLLHSLEEDLQQQKQKNSDLVKLCEQKESDSQQQTKTLMEELEKVQAQRDNLLSEKENSTQSSSEEMEKLLCRVTSLSEERDQLQETLEGLRQEKQQLRAELEDRMEMMQCESQQHLSSEPLSLKEEQEAQQLEQVQQLEKQLEERKEEVSQLKSDLQENVELMIENQEDLRASQEKIKVLQNEISMLRSQKAELQSSPQCGGGAESTLQIQALQNQIQSLTEESERVRAERDNLLSERTASTHQKESDSQQQTKTLMEELEKVQAQRDNLLSERTASTQSSSEEMEKLLCRVTSLSEERDQLQETLEGLRQETQQLRAELEDRMEMVEQLQASLQVASEQKSQLESDLQQNKEMATALQEQNQRNLDLERQSQESQARLEQESAETQCLLHSLEEDLQQQKQKNSDLVKLCEQKESDSQQQTKTLMEELEKVQAQRDNLLSEKENSTQSSSEEMEKLLCRVTSLSEERDQLQETLEGLRQEKQQFRAELEDRMEMVQTEMTQLNTSLHIVTEQKKQLEDDLQQKASTTQNLLKSVQEELCEQKKMNSYLQTMCQEKECSSDQQIKTLTEKLQNTKVERDNLLSERTASTQSSSEEMEKLLCRVTSLSEERDQLQETLEGLRQEKQQLRAELEDRMEMMSDICKELSEQQELNVQQQSDREKQEARLQQEVQQLKEQLQVNGERRTQTQAEADALQQSLSEANTTVSALREQLSSLDQGTTGVKETLSSRMHSSTEQLQESFRGFQHFIDNCSRYQSMPTVLRVQCSLKPNHLASLPKPTMNSYNAVCHLGLQTVQSLGNIMVHLQTRAQSYRCLFEELVKKDLAVFEERRLLDVLLCREHAPSYSLKDEDFNTLWQHRLTELLDKRQLYHQKMSDVLEKLWVNMASYPSELSAETRERERFNEQLQAAFTTQPISFSRLDNILSCELERRSAVVHSKKTSLQGIIGEHSGVFEELKLLEAQACSQLTEERSKSSTLLRALEGAPLKTELLLLKDNQQLVLQLQKTQEQVKALSLQNEQLEVAHIKADNRVSNHKQATQLLQTELQDTRAQVEERENAIQTLRSKLRESERNASPSAAELERLKAKLFKVEVELSSATDKHQQEIQRMTTVLNEKEDSLRKLKETLRRSQQQGEESFLQGEDLHAKLTNPRGLVIKSSIQLEKTKLEEEVKQLRVKIIELESLVSTQQAEISKWKSRAIKLKGKGKPEVDKPSSPCTPTKRGFLTTSDTSNFFSSPKRLLVTPKKLLESPKKLLDSPKASLLNSPKSRFFDMDGSSEILSRTCPKQFFDNSSLGTVPDAAAARKEEWWPQSPNQEEMCKTQ
ncbi:centromere-associated protein E isoform X2 [Seriola aureovittata]|uniref:centromere-associated protein E isoform X2 n=1 Tax=Seriola aureovittata TaxID=2871759 RepID=UPI0024BDBD08|nr:centromere-associated protein E isoform X2 [Seriola aureovittata]